MSSSLLPRTPSPMLSIMKCYESALVDVTDSSTCCHYNVINKSLVDGFIYMDKALVDSFIHYYAISPSVHKSIVLSIKTLFI